MVDLPQEGDEVFVTVGTALPVEDRAVVRGTATDIDEHGDTFVLDHTELLRAGVYAEKFENPAETMQGQTSGPYGPQFDEQQGEVWAYDRDELPI